MTDGNSADTPETSDDAEVIEVPEAPEASSDTGSGRGRPGWADDAEQALGRARDALKAAFDATKDQRAGALEAARSALGQIGDAVERGADAAKRQWEKDHHEPSASDEVDDVGLREEE